MLWLLVGLAGGNGETVEKVDGPVELHLLGLREPSSFGESRKKKNKKTGAVLWLCSIRT